MNARVSWTPSQAARALLAKLVMGISALVALASSPPPRWSAEQQAQVPLVFDERNERRAILSVELDGQLYGDVSFAEVEVIATADRTASDLELSVGPFEPSPDESAQAESITEAEADFRAGFEPESGDPTARANARYPNLVFLSIPVECAEVDPAAPRAESCLEQFEITLTRQSQRPLSVDLEVLVRVGGSRETLPDGTFEIHLEELAP